MITEEWLLLQLYINFRFYNKCTSKTPSTEQTECERLMKGVGGQGGREGGRLKPKMLYFVPPKLLLERLNSGAEGANS